MEGAAARAEGPLVEVEGGVALPERLDEDVLAVDRGGRAVGAERLELGAVDAEAREELGPEPGAAPVTPAAVDVAQAARGVLGADLQHRPAEPGDGRVLVTGVGEVRAEAERGLGVPEVGGAPPRLQLSGPVAPVLVHEPEVERGAPFPRSAAREYQVRAASRSPFPSLSYRRPRLKAASSDPRSQASRYRRMASSRFPSFSARTPRFSGPPEWPPSAACRYHRSAAARSPARSAA